MSLLAVGWIAFVILACTSDEESMVTGDRYSGGGCPPGEECAPSPDSDRTIGPPYFEGAQTPGAAMTAGELPPVATGATTWVRFVQRYETDSRWDDGVSPVFGATIDAEGMSVEPVRGRTYLVGVAAGAYEVRAENEEGELFDRITLRVVDAAEVYARPVVGFVGLTTMALGPERGWRVWPETELHFVERAFSSDGEPLVSLDSPEDGSHYDSAVAPAAGSLEVDVQAGSAVGRTDFPVVAAVDGFVRYVPTECGILRFADSQMCLFGVLDDQPVYGAPIEVSERGRDPYELSPELPCVERSEETRELSFTIADQTWTTLVPPRGDSCE